MSATPAKTEGIPSPPPIKPDAEVITINTESRINLINENYKRLHELFNMTEAELQKESEMQARRLQALAQHQQVQQAQQQQQQAQVQQGYMQTQQLQSPVAGGPQRPPSQQMNPNMFQNNMGPQMQQHQQQQMNMGMNSAMGMASIGANPSMTGTTGINPMSMDMGYHRGFSGGGMQR